MKKLINKLVFNIDLDYAYEKDEYDEYVHEESNIVDTICDVIEKAGYINKWTDSEGQAGCYYKIVIDIEIAEDKNFDTPDFVESIERISPTLEELNEGLGTGNEPWETVTSSDNPTSIIKF